MENLIEDISLLTDNNEEACETVKISIDQNTAKPEVIYRGYGCQMNFSDSEIVASILQKEGLILLGYQSGRPCVP